MCRHLMLYERSFNSFSVCQEGRAEVQQINLLGHFFYLYKAMFTISNIIEVDFLVVLLVSQYHNPLLLRRNKKVHFLIAFS